MNQPIELVVDWAKRIEYALHQQKDKGKKDEEIMRIILDTNNDDRQEIRACYEKIYEVKLIKELRQLLSGNFRKLCVGLFYTQVEYDAKQLNRAMKFLIKDDEAFFEILISRPKWMLELLKEAFTNFYSKDLIKEIEKYVSGDVRRNLLCLLTTERSVEEFPNVDDCIAEAKVLIGTPFKKWVNNLDFFNRMFVMKSPRELVYIARAYNEKTGKTLLTAIEKEFSGQMRILLKGILYAEINPPEWYADKIHKAISGLGTDINTLNRAVITRHEMDMPLVKIFFAINYKETIESFILGDTSGIYQKLLLALSSKLVIDEVQQEVKRQEEIVAQS